MPILQPLYQIVTDFSITYSDLSLVVFIENLTFFNIIFSKIAKARTGLHFQ